jgi:hypothetical protein
MDTPCSPLYKGLMSPSPMRSPKSKRRAPPQPGASGLCYLDGEMHQLLVDGELLADLPGRHRIRHGQ